MELSVKKNNRFTNNSNNINSINKTVTENDEILETERETHTEPFSRKKKIVLTGDSMVNGISETGLSVNCKVKIVNFPSSRSEKIQEKLDDIIKEKLEDPIFHAGTNDITNNVNLPTKVKKISTIFLKNHH